MDKFQKVMIPVSSLFILASIGLIIFSITTDNALLAAVGVFDLAIWGWNLFCVTVDY